ncbi:MAG: DegV family protein [Lactovum sp.]
MTIKIVTDSTISIDPTLVKELGITIVPLSYSISGTVYTDGDLTLSEYLNLIEKENKLPKTSQPPVGVFADTFSQLAADGSQIISIHLTNTLSGTVESARQGATLSGKDVTVVDSEFIDQALAFQVITAAKMAQEGASKEMILDEIQAIRENTDLYCCLSTLENLIKGGRIGRVAGLIGGLLDFRVVLRMQDSQLKPFSKGRGNKTFKKFLEELSSNIASSGRKVREIGIAHADNLDFAKVVKENLQRFVEKPVTIRETSTVIATHTGRLAFAVMISYK